MQAIVERGIGKCTTRVQQLGLPNNVKLVFDKNYVTCHIGVVQTCGDLMEAMDTHIKAERHEQQINDSRESGPPIC